MATTDDALAASLGRIWHAWTLLYTVPFIAAAAGWWLDPIAAPVALAALAHAWIIPELYAFRGASVARPKSRGEVPGEPVAQGLLGDLLAHEERELQHATGLAMERRAGRLASSGGRRTASDARRPAGPPLLVAATDLELPPPTASPTSCSRFDGRGGFATVANHAFAGAPWRVRRRLPEGMRPGPGRAQGAAQAACPPGSDVASGRARALRDSHRGRGLPAG